MTNLAKIWLLQVCESSRGHGCKNKQREKKKEGREKMLNAVLGKKEEEKEREREGEGEKQKKQEGEGKWLMQF